MYERCLEKQKKLRDLFSNIQCSEDRYNKIIDLGKKQPFFPEIHKTNDKLVAGCQSKLYLYSFKGNGLVHFQTYSDALISAGLGMLLTEVYSGEYAEVILKCPPTFIDDLGIAASLSPNRSNGLYSLHLKMKQEALKFLMF
jgi:cysteine desulfuration protein SufE